MKYAIALALLATPLVVCAKGNEDNPASVIVENTPGVIVENMPGVEVLNTPSVTIDGVPSVQIDGTPGVTVTNEVATDPRIRQISGLDITGFGRIIDTSNVCDDPADTPPCRLSQADVPAPASLTHLAVAVGESTSTGDSKCWASVVYKNDRLDIYRALANLQSQAGVLRTLERTYPIPLDLSEPDSVVELVLGRQSGTGRCMLEVSGFGTFTPLE